MTQSLHCINISFLKWSYFNVLNYALVMLINMHWHIRINCLHYPSLVALTDAAFFMFRKLFSCLAFRTDSILSLRLFVRLLSSSEDEPDADEDRDLVDEPDDEYTGSCCNCCCCCCWFICWGCCVVTGSDCWTIFLDVKSIILVYFV